MKNCFIKNISASVARSKNEKAIKQGIKHLEALLNESSFPPCLLVEHLLTVKKELQLINKNTILNNNIKIISDCIFTVMSIISISSIVLLLLL